MENGVLIGSNDIEIEIIFFIVPIVKKFFGFGQYMKLYLWFGVLEKKSSMKNVVRM